MILSVTWGTRVREGPRSSLKSESEEEEAFKSSVSVLIWRGKEIFFCIKKIALSKTVLSFPKIKK
jgi:hypothetical protein